MSATWTWNAQSENSTHRLDRSQARPEELALDVLESTAVSKSTTVQKSTGTQTVLAQSPLIAAALQGWQWLVARCKGGAPTQTRPTLRVLSQLPLGGRKTLTLIDLEGQRYLVGGGSDSVTAILAIQSEGDATREPGTPSTSSTMQESA